MKSCLLVDDSRVVRQIARKIVEELQFSCTEAEDGKKAMEACQVKMPDAILLDWNMPVMTFPCRRVGRAGLRGWLVTISV